jgi:serine/threonine protein kinase
MAFQHNSQYYLVFPLAEEGNLKDLWQKTRKQPTSQSDVQWVLKQCLGIADGLWKIHKHESWFANSLAPSRDEDKNRGRHGDIKPQNILVFSEKGQYRLVISDFGLTRFHSAHSISNVPLDKVGGLSRTYRAPEYDLQSTISQAYDMWSLGCLYLELISWLLLGFDNGPKKFAILRGEDDVPTPGLPPLQNYTEDKFFNIHNNKPEVKKSVTDVCISNH